MKRTYFDDIWIKTLGWPRRQCVIVLILSCSHDSLAAFHYIVCVLIGPFSGGLLQISHIKNFWNTSMGKHSGTKFEGHSLCEKTIITLCRRKESFTIQFSFIFWVFYTKLCHKSVLTSKWNHFELSLCLIVCDNAIICQFDMCNYFKLTCFNLI